MIITIAGLEGSGKSTLAHGLADALGFKFYSMGDVRKRYALDHDLTLEQLNDLRKKQDIKSDVLVDEYQEKLGKTDDNFVLDSRMGFYFVRHAIKILVVADIGERAKRMLADIKAGKRPFEPYLTVSAVKNYIKKRNESDVDFYTKLYDVNPYDLSHYDLVVDSTHMSADEKLAFVLKWLRDHPRVS